MEIFVGLALFFGIIIGVWRAIAGAENRRLRNALTLSTEQGRSARAEADLLRITLLITEDALKRRDDDLVMHDVKIRDLQRRVAIADAGEPADSVEIDRLLAQVAEHAEFVTKAKKAGIRFDGDNVFIDGDKVGAGVEYRMNDSGKITAMPAGVIPVAAIAGDDDCSAVIVPAGTDGAA